MFRLRGRLRVDLTTFSQLAAFYLLAGLSIAWAEFTTVPTSVWTGLQYALMGAVIFVHWQMLVRPSPGALLHLIWLVSFPLFAYLSILTTQGVVAGRGESFERAIFVVTLGVTEFLFGMVLARTLKLRTCVVALAVLVFHSWLRQHSFTAEGIAESIILHNRFVNYQVAGDAIACAAVLAVSFTPSRRLVILVSIAAVYGLFTVSSRSAAFVGIVALASYWLRFLSWRSTGLLLTGAILGLTALHNLDAGDAIGQLVEGTRFETMFGGQIDTSADARAMSLESGLEIIRQYPFTGFFAFELDRFGIGGLYVHNGLDIWVQAGLPSFLLFLAGIYVLLKGYVPLLRFDPATAYSYLPMIVFVLGSWALARVPYAGAIVVVWGFTVTRVYLASRTLPRPRDTYRTMRNAKPIRLVPKTEADRH